MPFPDRLRTGYQSFLNSRYPTEQDRYRKLAEAGQEPETMVISCCDSRVSPETIFDSGPGELFVVRNVANLVPSCEHESSACHGTSAAIEFAVQALQVKHIVVLGHAHCGGIRAAVQPGAPLTAGDFIGRWTAQIRHLVACTEPEPDLTTTLHRVELAVIEHSLKMLLTYPAIHQRVERGELQLHGAYFAIASGELLLRDRASGRFVPCLSPQL